MKMMTLGLRNLMRNARRSAAVATSIAAGFAALALFSGYMSVVYRALSEQAIYGELIGHVTISRTGMTAEGRLHPEKFLLTREDSERIATAIRTMDPRLVVVPRLALTGMLSNGRASTVFIAEGIDPAAMQLLRGPRQMASGALPLASTDNVTVAEGLAGMLGLKPGTPASMLVGTVHGQANAVDVMVADTFGTGNAGTDDKFLYLPLALAQSLADADGRADRLTVLQARGEPAADLHKRIEAALASTGLALEVRPWQQMSGFYRQVKSMFDVIFGFLLVIVLVIVAMSIANAMSMGVIERTREIGTLRTLGMQRGGVIRMFVTEALLLIALGCLSGLALAVAVRHAVNEADIRYLPPNATEAVPLLIGLDWSRLALSAVALAVLGLAAALVPAARAARRPLTESLAHV